MKVFNPETLKYISFKNERAYFGERPPRDQGSSQGGAGDSPLSQLYKIDIQVEESDQDQEKKDQVSGEVDHR